MPFAKIAKSVTLGASALVLFAQPVLAASTCATDSDVAAFRTAAVAQQLMVAALTCKDIEAYNRFVLSYQPELQKSDADLKAYFIRRGSEAEYDTFKTKLANLSSLSDIANGPAYCENAAAAFDMALKNRQSLSSFVADRRLMIALPQQTLCAAPKVIEAAAAIKAPGAAPVKLAEARPAKLAAAKSAPPVRLAAAEPQKQVDVDPVVHVPAHALPAAPFGGAPDAVEAPPAPPAYSEASYTNAPESSDELPLPPRPPRTREASRLEAYYAAQYAQTGRYRGQPDAESYYGDDR